MDGEKRPRGRPRGTGRGETTSRSLRIGALWDEAAAIATQRGETMTAVVEAALRRYVSRHRNDSAAE